MRIYHRDHITSAFNNFRHKCGKEEEKKWKRIDKNKLERRLDASLCPNQFMENHKQFSFDSIVHSLLLSLAFVSIKPKPSLSHAFQFGKYFNALYYQHFGRYFHSFAAIKELIIMRSFPFVCGSPRKKNSIFSLKVVNCSISSWLNSFWWFLMLRFYFTYQR